MTEVFIRLCLRCLLSCAGSEQLLLSFIFKVFNTACEMRTDPESDVGKKWACLSASRSEMIVIRDSFSARLCHFFMLVNTFVFAQYL